MIEAQISAPVVWAPSNPRSGGRGFESRALPLWILRGSHFRAEENVYPNLRSQPISIIMVNVNPLAHFV